MRNSSFPNTLRFTSAFLMHLWLAIVYRFSNGNSLWVSFSTRVFVSAVLCKVSLYSK